MPLEKILDRHMRESNCAVLGAIDQVHATFQASIYPLFHMGPIAYFPYSVISYGIKKLFCADRLIGSEQLLKYPLA